MVIPRGFLNLISYPADAYLQLPKSFVQEYYKREHPVPMIRVQLHDQTVWNLTIGTINGKIALISGWASLSLYLRLKKNDYVVVYPVQPDYWLLIHVHGDSSSQHLPLFYHIVTNHFDPYIPIDKTCVQNHLGHDVHNRYFTVRANHDFEGRLKVHAHRGKFAFIVGVYELHCQFPLQNGDFLLFILTDDSTLSLSIFNADGYEVFKPSIPHPQIPQITIKNEGAEDAVDMHADDEDQITVKNEGVENAHDGDADDGVPPVNDDVDDGAHDNYITFIRIAKDRLRLPIALALYNDFENHPTINVRNLQGHVTQMLVRSEPSRNHIRYALRSWGRYMKANGIMYGDTCTFQYIVNEGMLVLMNVAKV